MTAPIISCKKLCKTFTKGDNRIDVLRDVDLELHGGSMVAVLGPSGCGKSTFMHMLGLLERPTSGELQLFGTDVTLMSDQQRAKTRNLKIGFVFQAHNLLPELSALGNVMLPVRLAGSPVSVAEGRAEALLKAVGLGNRLRHQPGELSGGEQQRVALARAMVMGPGLILADEPTGNLDPKTATGVFELLLELNRQLGSLLVVVTHSHDLAARFPRRLVLEDGSFVEGA